MQKIIKTLTFKDMTDGKGETNLYITDYMASPYVRLGKMASNIPNFELMPKLTPLENQNGTIKEAYSLEDLTVWAYHTDTEKEPEKIKWYVPQQEEARDRYANFMVNALYPKLASNDMLEELKQGVKNSLYIGIGGFSFIKCRDAKTETQLVEHNKLINTVISGVVVDPATDGPLIISMKNRMLQMFAAKPNSK